jgi:hypothetical protein
MSTLLTQLEAAVERYGRTAVADPVALAGALRAATDPPPEPEIEALVQVASTDAVQRLRAELAAGADPEQALAVAAAAAAGGGLDAAAARRATALTGAALGLLPRGLAADDDAETLDLAGSAPTEVVTRAVSADNRPVPRRRRGPVLAAVAVGVVATAGLALATLPGSALLGPTPAPTSTVAGPASAATPDSDPAEPAPDDADIPFSEAATTDLDAEFRDPQLRAFAEPYLQGPIVACRAGTEPQVNVAESVTCDLGNGRIGMFSKMLGVEVMRDLRAGFLAGRQAAPGTVRSLPWRYVADRPGVRTGIPVTRNDPAEGIRVRYIEVTGAPRLYFDQESCACTGFFGLSQPSGNNRVDLDALRAYWADPAR